MGNERSKERAVRKASEFMGLRGKLAALTSPSLSPLALSNCCVILLCLLLRLLLLLLCRHCLTVSSIGVMGSGRWQKTTST